MTEYQKALKAKDAAITAVEKHAPDNWKELAHWAGEQVAKRQQYLTSEDVRDMLDRNHVPEPKEHRAIGPVMMRLRNAGIIRNTGEFRRYTRRSRHTGITYVWESKIWRPT